MAALPLAGAASWFSPAAVVAAPHSARPISCRVVHAHPLGQKRGTPPALVRVPASRSRCLKDADHHHHHEIEPEQRDAATSKKTPFIDLIPANSDDPMIQEMRKYHVAIAAAAGLRDPPDIFRKEKDEISNYMMKIASSSADDEHMNTIMALYVCIEAQKALDLASMVMDLTDIASLDLGATEFSQHTANQMVRSYTHTFCDAAADAYHKTIKLDKVLSFVDALRGLGAICHIVVQDTVAMLKDGTTKIDISGDMDKDSHDFHKKLDNLKEEYTMAREIKHTVVMDILLEGMRHTQSYVFQLVRHRRAAISDLLLAKASLMRKSIFGKKQT